jgi:hypothetical protein
MLEEGTVLVGISKSPLNRFYVVRVVDGEKMAVVFEPQCVESMNTHTMKYWRFEVHDVTGGGAAYPLCFDKPSNRWVVQEGGTLQVKCTPHKSGTVYITIMLT